ncbi:LacI family transcriptional regulator [Nocardiopsis composta]|uniref:LacI family transcriptional regulator n=1 Tax=Nocardiopsis composta TaxID=157465 RepID=A0A7W8QTH6_9ACTN|nr:LacI family transcriptional regulator [Nocardiopsis composta]
MAAHAGVSLGTVSNVLNRPELVSERTRGRVQRSIEALGFIRNDSARQLRSGASRTVAYVLHDTANPFFTDVADGVQRTTDPAGLALYLCNSGEDADRQAFFLDLLEQQRVTGVLITPVDPDDPRIAALAARGTPVVLVDRPARGDLCSVAVDDVLGGDIAAEHLLAAGHRRLAFVGGPLPLGQVADRLSGARRALQRTGGADLQVVETAALTIAEGRRAAEHIAALPAGHRPTAVFCANDLLALGVLRQCAALGLRVPEDIALVGYDDIEFAEAAAVPLTSVRQPRRLLGRTAAELLLAEARDTGGHEHRRILYDPELIVRASTSGPAPSA